MSAPNRKGMGLGDALGIWLAIGFIVDLRRRDLRRRAPRVLDGRHRRTPGPSD